MRDLYKRLRIPEDASDETIRQALPSTDAPLRQDVEFVLLDPRRRGVYDRNRRVLVTIGKLRAHLGLTYTRLWARSDFKDFWPDLAPADPGPRKRRVNSLMIAHAIRTAHRHGRRHAARWGKWWISLWAIVIFALLVALWRHLM